MSQPTATGFRCDTCRAPIELGSMMTQSVGVLIHMCAKCGSKYSINRGNVIRLRKGRGKGKAGK